MHADSYGVYGIRTMDALVCRQGWEIGRDQTGRLMRAVGICGVNRSKKVFTRKHDLALQRPADGVKRRFIADAPRRLWVADITFVAFVIDVYSRRFVGWNYEGRHPAPPSPRYGCLGRRGSLEGLVHHADHWSNYMSLVFTDRIVELGATPSTGAVGDSYDNAPPRP